MQKKMKKPLNITIQQPDASQRAVPLRENGTRVLRKRKRKRIPIPSKSDFDINYCRRCQSKDHFLYVCCNNWTDCGSMYCYYCVTHFGWNWNTITAGDFICPHCLNTFERDPTLIETYGKAEPARKRRKLNILDTVGTVEDVVVSATQKDPGTI